MIINFFNEMWILLKDMAPYLLLGYFIAGILNIIISRDFIYKHLSKKNFLSIIKSTLFGIPMPLCSCGVIPVSSHLQKKGASKGSVLAFLISTPTSGVDSIFATYSLLGPVFAVIRPLASFFGGLIAGIFSNIFDRKSIIKDGEDKYECNSCESKINIKNKIYGVFYYGFIELIQDTAKWIVLGIVLGALLSVFVPESFINTYLGNHFLSYLAMFLIAIPMYVCATASIPIAMVLILKGLTLGGALIFLIAGPATNTATITFILGKMGKKTLAIYLFSIIITSIVFALFMDFVLVNNFNLQQSTEVGKMLPNSIKVISAIILLILILRVYIVKLWKIRKYKRGDRMAMYKLNISNMSCEHCVKILNEALSNIISSDKFNINLKEKTIDIFEECNIEEIKNAIIKAGYSVGDGA